MHLIYLKKNDIEKKNKDKKNNYNREIAVNDLDEIIGQYNEIKDMGRVLSNGIIRSKRQNKGKNPDRYIDPNFKEIFMEDNTIEDFLGSSDGESIYSDDSTLDDILYSDEEDTEWNIDSDYNTEDEL